MKRELLIAVAAVAAVVGVVGFIVYDGRDAHDTATEAHRGQGDETKEPAASQESDVQRRRWTSERLLGLRKDLPDDVPRVSANPQQRAREERIVFEMRTKWSQSYLQWVEDAGLDEEREHQVRLALADLTTRFWLTALSGVALQDAEADNQEAREEFRKRLEQVLTPEQLRLFESRFQGGEMFVATRVIQPEGLEELLANQSTSLDELFPPKPRVYSEPPPGAYIRQ